MHQPDSAADARAKMAHPAMLPRRGNSGGGGTPGSVGGNTSSSSSSSAGLEEYPPVLLIQSPPPPPPAAASSSGPPPPPPPQSLALLSQQQPPPAQPPPLGQAGAQLKKKSGFQITSVTPAQISASLSSNNSIAEDTESYDDLDESHTEDFSSSEILDVSLSRATDLGEPERSSSEETLNNFHEVESPGAVSPNQPRLPQQSSVLTNGSIHPPHGHHFPHHPNGHHQPSAHSGAGGPPSSPSFRKLPVSGSLEGPGPGAPSISTLAAATVAHFRPTPAGGGGANSAAGGGFGGTGGRLRQGSKILGNLASAGLGTALSGGSVPGNVSVSSGAGNGAGTSSNASGSAATPAAATPSGHLQPAASTSRFRVVKLDSSSEPFKKGRWTCTEFYDKENPGPPPAGEGAAGGKAADALLEVASERETTSGSSVSSTLSHYTESVGSGEMGAPSGAPPPAFQGIGSQQMDFGSAGALPLTAPGLPQSMSQSQLSQVQFHPQDVSYSQQKPGVPPASAAPPVSMVGGHQPSLASQQLPFTPPTQPVLTLPVAPQPQPLPFGQGPAQHPPVLQPMPMQMASGHVKPVTQASGPGPALDYTQPPPPQQILPTPAASLKPGPAVVGTGPAVPPAVPLPIQAHVAVAAPQPVAPAQPAISAPMMTVGPHGTAAPVGQPATVANPIGSSAVGQAAAPLPSQAAPVVPVGVVHPGSQGAPPSLPQPLSLAPQSALIPGQPTEPLVQAMGGQQLPPVSPLPSASATPVPGHPAVNGPPAAPSKNAAQALGVPTMCQPPVVSGNLNLPAAPNVLLSSTQFSAPSLAQSILARPEDSKRATESTLGGLPQLPSGEGSIGPSPALSDGSMVSSLFPLKVLPLTSQQLLDGEDDSSSGASVVAIDNKIEQAMDLVKSHLMYAVREEVEVLKEQIKELVEKNAQLEQENSLLKTLASPEQLAQFQAQLQTGSSPASSQPQGTTLQPSQPAPQGSGPSA